jgi:hypothetical protein
MDYTGVTHTEVRVAMHELIYSQGENNPECRSQSNILSHSFIHSAMVLQPFIGPWPLLQFPYFFYIVGRTPWTSDQPVTRPLPTHRATKTQNKRIQTSIPWVGFESTIPASERAKTVHALDRAATVIGNILSQAVFMPKSSHNKKQFKSYCFSYSSSLSFYLFSIHASLSSSVRNENCSFTDNYRA